MDIASLLGVILGIGMVLFGIIQNGGVPALLNFLDAPSAIITIGGSLSAVLCSNKLSGFIAGIKSFALPFKEKSVDPGETINKIIELSNVSRKEGLLALEEAAGSIDDEFLKKGIMLVVDGTDAELVRGILETDMLSMEERHKKTISFWEFWGEQGPAWGMIGTLIGLINMLKNLEDSSTIGPNMAVALVTTSEIDKVEGKEITEFHLEGEAEQTAQASEETKKADKEEKEEKTPAAKTESSKPKTANNSQKQAVSHKKATTSRTVRVDIEKLDMLMNQVSELIIAKNSLVAMSSSDGENNNNQSFHEQIEYLERITTNLHESVMKVRMVPIESVTQKYPRMIRDLSRTLNKKMNLVITGEDTELDRTVVDQIGDPLQHLLRNSADHGLESNEVRLERGKPEVGTIFLNAYQEGNNVVIKVGDDGNGIDTEAVKNKAIERGIVTAEQAENLSQKDIINFLFMPSFSMAKQITDISGRGVGLDVVKSGIEQLGGDVSVSTELGKGTTFTVRLPLTLAIIQALMVEIRDEIYAIALGSISNIEDIPVKDIKYVQAKEVIHLRGSVIPIIRLDKMLDIEPKEQEPDHLTVVIVQKGDQQAGLVVDNLIGQQEIVIKSLGKYINGNKLISGATILGDGDVALILDVNTLM